MNTSRVRPRKGWFRNKCVVRWSVLGLSLLLGLVGKAATPPTISVAYTAPGGTQNSFPSIQAGVAVGDNGNVYFATSSFINEFGATVAGQVTALNSSHTVLWNYNLGPFGKVFGVPSLAPSLAPPAIPRLYFGNDDGQLICLNATTGQELWVFDELDGGDDHRIRCTPAINFNQSQVGADGAVYFQSNDGKMYALNGSTGLLLWSASTGNIGGPPSNGGHTQTWSSSPVIAADGTVYVGSGNGKVYGFNTAGVKVLEVTIGRAIEASLAIAANGWLFGGTRENLATGNDGIVFAINPAEYTVNDPSAAIKWTHQDSHGMLGYLASPLIDQAGFVYMTHFGHVFQKFHPAPSGGASTGPLLTWDTGYKLCQTPAMNQYGHVFFGGTTADGNIGEFFALDLANHDETIYWQSSLATPPPPSFGGFLGAVMIRATSTGRVYFADMKGRLYYFNSNSPLMAGDWPTFQGGSRRTGVQGSWPFTIAQLPGFYGSTYGANGFGGLNVWGEAVGAADGYYNYPASGPYGTCGARWIGITLTGFGGPTAIGGSHANSINDFGDAVGHSSSGPVAWGADALYGAYLSVPAGFSLASARATDLNLNPTTIASKAVGYGSKFEDGVTKVKVVAWTRSGGAWTSAQDAGVTAGNLTYPYAISDDGRIAGKARFTVGGPYHGFVTDFTGDIPNATDIGTFSGNSGHSSEAWDVDSEAGTTGWAHNAAGKQRAFRLRNGEFALNETLHALPRLPNTVSTTYNSSAKSVNRFGQVVGRIQNDANAYRAFRSSPASLASDPSNDLMQDLNGLALDGGQTPGGLGWNLTETVAINDAGAMVGFGIKSGVTRGWILYPKSVE